MADKSFDRTVIYPLERPLASDINQAASQMDRTLRDLLMRQHSRRFNNASDVGVSSTTGFIADGLKVQPTSPVSMSVQLRAGAGFAYNAADAPNPIDAIVGLSDLSPYKPLYLSATETISVPAADPVNPRIDIVEVKIVDRRRENSASRDVLDPGTGVFTATNLLKTLAFDLSGRSAVNDATKGVNYKTGTPAGVPVAPAVDAGYVKIAEIRVDAAVGSIAKNKIQDLRKMLWPYNTGLLAVEFSLTVGVPLAAPVLLGPAHAPPGVEFTVVSRDIAGVRLADVYVVPGDTVSYAWVESRPRGVATTIVGEFTVVDTDLSFGPASAGDVADMAGANAAQVINIAEGQPIITARCVPKRQAAGVTGQGGLGTPTITALVTYRV